MCHLTLILTLTSLFVTVGIVVGTNINENENEHEDEDEDIEDTNEDENENDENIYEKMLQIIVKNNFKYNKFSQSSLSIQPNINQNKLNYVSSPPIPIPGPYKNN